MNLTLWNFFSSSRQRLYNLQYIRTNSLNQRYLTTVVTTIIKESDPAIQKREMQAHDSFDIITVFPATIYLFQEACYCKKSNRKATSIRVFVIYNNCNLKPLIEYLRKNVQERLYQEKQYLWKKTVRKLCWKWHMSYFYVSQNHDSGLKERET